MTATASPAAVATCCDAPDIIASRLGMVCLTCLTPQEKEKPVTEPTIDTTPSDNEEKSAATPTVEVGAVIDIPAGHDGLTRGFRMLVDTVIPAETPTQKTLITGRQLPSRGAGKPGRTRHVAYRAGDTIQTVDTDGDTPAAPRPAKKPKKLPQTHRYALYRALQNLDLTPGDHDNSWTPRGAHLAAIRKLRDAGLVEYAQMFTRPVATEQGRWVFFDQDPASYGYDPTGIKDPRQAATTTSGVPTVTADPGSDGIEIRADRLYMYTDEPHEIWVVDGMTGNPDAYVWADLCTATAALDGSILITVQIPDSGHVTIEPGSPSQLYKIRTAR